MIRDFRHKGIRQFFETGTTRGIQVSHQNRLRLQLTALNVAMSPNDMAVPGWRLHALQGDKAGQWAVSVSGNWRLTFAFEGNDAVLVDYQDYH